MTASAQTLFDTAPLGALVAFSDGEPRPPERFARKLRAWRDRNATGRLIRRTPARAGRPAAFTLLLGGLRAEDLLVLIVQRSFEVACALTFEVVDGPKTGEILCLTPYGDELELRHVAADLNDAAAWLDRNRYCRALFHEVRPGGATRAILLPDGLVA
ncbi:hypothetical protein ACETK8_20030 (plasmid) [Brevundimonas staleyi]|uniref:Uncharacterized protein n=1 Tax=Brevundimonas staleyi TaxID=74326 RepID=A0ABW0FP30_9CAUL